MLDKSLPYQNIIMRMNAATVCSLKEPDLPAGYVFSRYRDGDEADWAALESAVLEFDEPQAAIKYFQQEFLTEPEEARKRVCFIRETSTGRAVATAAAWFRNVNNSTTPILHWVSVHPSRQRQGLGRAIVQKALTLFQETEPGLDVYLHTQTWSHAAVRLYASMGFRVCRSTTIFKRDRKSGLIQPYPNDFMKAMRTLSIVLNQNVMEQLITQSVE